MQLSVWLLVHVDWLLVHVDCTVHVSSQIGRLRWFVKLNRILRIFLVIYGSCFVVVCFFFFFSSHFLIWGELL